MKNKSKFEPTPGTRVRWTQNSYPLTGPVCAASPCGGMLLVVDDEYSQTWEVEASRTRPTVLA